MTTDHSRAGGTPDHPYAEVQATEEFQQLKRTLRRFIFPATVLFLAWYTAFILLTAYARDFMSQKVLGEINVAYVLGLLQFVSTFVIAWVYSRFAEKHFDPTADAIRHRMEGAPASIDLTAGDERTRVAS